MKKRIHGWLQLYLKETKEVAYSKGVCVCLCVSLCISVLVCVRKKNHIKTREWILWWKNKWLDRQAGVRTSLCATQRN